MKSAWFWNTSRWAQYQHFYYSDRPMVVEYKSSPLADDCEFNWESQRTFFDLSIHETQVIDLTLTQDELWRGIRKSYRPLINKALKDYEFKAGNLTDYHRL